MRFVRVTVTTISGQRTYPVMAETHAMRLITGLSDALDLWTNQSVTVTVEEAK